MLDIFKQIVRLLFSFIVIELLRVLILIVSIVLKTSCMLLL